MTKRSAQSFIPIETEGAFGNVEYLEEDELELSSNTRSRHFNSNSEGESDGGEGIVTLHQEIEEFYRWDMDIGEN